MPPPKAALSPLRFATPGQLVMCLLLFFLPWIEIQCPVPDLNKIQAEPGKKAAPPDLKSMPYVPLITQSGFEAATGSYTFADPMLRQQMDQKRKAGAGNIEKSLDKNAKAAAPASDKDKDEPGAAPLLWLYLVAVLAGIAVGFALQTGKVRQMVLIGCCALALVAAGGQAAIGFPITQKIREQPTGMPGGAAADGAPKMNPDDVLKTVYKIPFFLALLFCVGGIVTAALTPNGPVKPRRPVGDVDDDEDDRPRKRRRRDQDDEDEDDDEPRQRRKRRDEDEEVDVDRPRKKRSEEATDEPKPRRDEKPGRADKWGDTDKGGGGRGDTGGKPGKPPAEDPGNPFNFG
jgi:hypothetical protein